MVKTNNVYALAHNSVREEILKFRKKAAESKTPSVTEGSNKLNPASNPIMRQLKEQNVQLGDFI